MCVTRDASEKIEAAMALFPLGIHKRMKGRIAVAMGGDGVAGDAYNCGMHPREPPKPGIPTPRHSARCDAIQWLVCEYDSTKNTEFGFFFSSRRRHTRSDRDWSSDVCSSDLGSSTPAARRERSGGEGRSLPGRVAGVELPLDGSASGRAAVRNRLLEPRIQKGDH